MKRLIPAIILLFTAIASAQVPVVIDTTITDVTSTTAIVGANVTSQGGFPITARGSVYDESPNPTGNQTLVAGTLGIFTGPVTGLSANTMYFFRGFGQNIQGRGYSGNFQIYTDPWGPYRPDHVAGPDLCELVWDYQAAAGILVSLREGYAAPSDPSDGVEYTANPVFGLGQELSSGDYFVYKGTGKLVVVTGLTPGTTYHAKIYTYSGTGAAINYNTNHILSIVFTTIPEGGDATIHDEYRERYSSHGNAEYRDRYNSK